MCAMNVCTYYLSALIFNLNQKYCLRHHTQTPKPFLVNVLTKKEERVLFCSPFLFSSELYLVSTRLLYSIYLTQIFLSFMFPSCCRFLKINILMFVE